MNAGRDDVEAFAGKWRQRWPEWRIVEVFVATDQRATATAWFALWQELADAAWGGEDPTPGLAKLAWWQQELHGWAKGARRHPLGVELIGRPVDWDALARSLGVLRDREAIHGEVERLLAELAPLGRAIEEAERRLFGGTAHAPPDAVCAVLVGPWLAREPERAEALLARWPIAHEGTRPRRLLAAIARARVVDAARGRGGASRWATLWRAWRAARN